MKIMKISLGDCVKFLAIILQENEVKLPFWNYEPWHLLFYKLKTSKEFVKKPSFFDRLRFDWDGPYPKSSELSELLNGLCVTGAVICDSPQYENYRLSKDIFTLWRQELGKLDETTKQFLKTAANIASKEFREYSYLK